MAPIHNLPLEILENIIIELHDDPTRPPAAILPFLFTSKYFYSALGFKTNRSLYGRMFRLSFDHSAPARRLGDLNASGFSVQLRANYNALKAIRRCDIHADDVLQTFWTAFSMLMENDGKNCCHLVAAGLPQFVDSFLRQRLYENAVNGWPADNELNALALWLLWLTMSEERLRAETPAQRAQMTKLILPYVLMPVRYAAYLAPHVHHSIPLSPNPPERPHSFITAHGRYPHYRNSFSRSLPLYHVNDLELGFPLASVAAKLIYFSHRELFPIAVPPHLPRNRDHARHLGLYNVGPTQDDVKELNAHKVASFVHNSTWDWSSEIKNYDNLGREARSKLAPSARWDDDWNRITDCINVFTPVSLRRTHYTPGLLCGLWHGRMLFPDDLLHGNIIQTPQMPATFDEQSVGLTVTPVFMRLREYHCMDVESNQPIPSGGIQNAWLPSSTQWHEYKHALTITCQERTSHYDEYVAGGPPLHDESKCRGCTVRGTPDMVFREHDDQYLTVRDDQYISVLDDVLTSEGMEDVDDDKDDAMSDDASEPDVNMAGGVDEELVLTRKCDGILDIVLVGETDTRHAQAWHNYKFYGRVREWDGLVALIRVPVHTPGPALGVWIFTGYVVGGQSLVGNWRMTTHPGEPVTFEGAFAMSKRE